MVNIETQKIFKRIGTHNGKFHADEVVATAILKEIFEVELIRTRDEKILEGLDIVYDVGGGLLDHHGIDKTYRKNGTPYAACGLVWNKYGQYVIKLKNPSLGEEEVEGIFSYMDRNFMEGIDALDNGIWIDRTEIPLAHLSSIIGDFNTTWDSNKDEDDAFNEAVEYTRIILRNAIEQRFAVLRAKEHVAKAYKSRKTKEILELDIYCPYGEALRRIDEKEEVLFVVYPRKDSYAMQSVRGENGEDKRKLPKAWAGLRDEELAKVTGVSDAIFCHTGRFITVAASYEGIMKLAKLAVEEPSEEKKSAVLGFIRNLFSEK